MKKEEKRNHLDSTTKGADLRNKSEFKTVSGQILSKSAEKGKRKTGTCPWKTGITQP